MENFEDSDTNSEPSILQYSGSEDYEPPDEFSSDDSRHPEPPDNAAVFGDEGNDNVLPADDIAEEPAKRTRKRQKRESKRADRKKKRNSGLSYKTRKGKNVLAKTFANNHPCSCKKECSTKIDAETRKHAFSVFWKLGSFKLQNTYLCGLVKQEIPKFRRPRDGSRQEKSSSNSFYIHTVSGNSMNVCRQFFVDTFQISQGHLTRALKKMKEGKPPGMDERGCHVPVNKIPEERMNVVREHISSFPSYQSHYTRSHNPNRKYLPSELTITAMYKAYLEYCNDKCDPVSEAVYRRTFNFEFNLHFHSPLKDTCSKCDAFKNKLSVLQNEEEKRQLNSIHELHLRKAEAARTAKNEDTARSKVDPNFYAFTFDLEKALPFPRLTTSIAYYKRNMYLYNLGCHELQNGLGFMYTWDETTASRGSQEISSCVTKHLLTRARNRKHIVMYSDTCTGQNRNWNFALSMQKLTQTDTSIDIIDLKYMVSGHSFLPNDTGFAAVESYGKRKLQVIFSPNDWNEAILKCRNKTPFHLTKMEREEFFSATELVDTVTKRSVNENGGKFNWLKTQWIRFIREEPFKLFYKETVQNDVDFESVDLTWSKAKKKKNKNADQIPVGQIEQRNLYNAPRPVTREKKRDMIDLLDYIPPIHHNFYQNLITNETVEDIGPLDDVSMPEPEEEN